jgi:hypothetical protein
MTSAAIPARNYSRRELQSASRFHSRRGANPLPSSSWPISSPGPAAANAAATKLNLMLRAFLAATFLVASKLVAI